MPSPRPAPERVAGPSPLAVGVVRETAPRERRVALDPETAAKLVSAGHPVLVEAGAGRAACFPDRDYAGAGAELLDRAAVVARADVLAVVRTPDPPLAAALRAGQVLLGLLDPLGDPELMAELGGRGLTVVAFDLLPRTLSRAQAMDAVSSQASAAGYRAGVLAAATSGRYFPMMITASGTARPVSVLVVGSGVAGLQAIGTAKRLGAVVTGYDVRPASRGEVESLGARFLTSTVAEAAGAGGYARALTADEAVRQQTELAAHVVGFDVVITTAKVPGHQPPLLVTASTLGAMRPGSVCLDLAAGAQRGNVAGSVDGETTVTASGVTVIGAGNLAADLPTSASQMYARNVAALLASLTRDGVLAIDPDDEVHRAVVVHPACVQSRTGASSPGSNA